MKPGARVCHSVVTPTITAGAYDANDVVGGLLTFSGVFKGRFGEGSVESLVVGDEGAESKNLELTLFRVSPATGSTITDNAALVLHDDFLDDIIGKILVSNWSSFSASGFGSAHNCGIYYDLATGTSLYGVCRALEAVTYDSTDALKFSLFTTQVS